MKLSDYAKKLGVSYRTAWNYYKKGDLAGFKTSTGTIIIEDKVDGLSNSIAIYCRVSSSQNKSNLETQKDRLISYCLAKGYKIEKVVTEIGSGVNDNRSKWLSLLKDTKIKLIVVEHKDRFTRFGFNGYKTLLNSVGRDIEVVNNTDSNKDDLLQDLVSIITSFCARLYGLRRSRRKTEKLIQGLLDDKKVDNKLKL